MTELNLYNLSQRKQTLPASYLSITV